MITMNALNQAIKNAFANGNDNQAINKAYLEFIKANFIIPIEHSEAEEDPRVLFLVEDEKVYLPVFTEMVHLDNWAKEINQEIKLLKLSAVDLLKGLGEEVIVCLDIGSEYYKQFEPAETARMKSMILKLFKN